MLGRIVLVLVLALSCFAEFGSGSGETQLLDEEGKINSHDFFFK